MKSKKLSLILLSYYSENRIVKVYQNVKELLDKHNIPFEFIIVDDGSEDDSYKVALELEEQIENVRAYQLSKNHTSHYSIFAGLSMVEGDCALPIVDDEQQPYDTIVDMYNIWLKGEKIIIPHRITRDDHWKSRIFSEAYYKR